MVSSGLLKADRLKLFLYQRRKSVTNIVNAKMSCIRFPDAPILIFFCNEIAEALVMVKNHKK